MMIKKYLRLLVAFGKASFQADLEYRMNFVSRIVTDVFWYMAQIFTFEALFRHTDSLGGWTLEQSRVFLGLLFVSDALYMIFLSDNMDKFSERVRKGEMDLLLVKPVNSQFIMSFQRFATAITGNLIISIVWLFWSLAQLPDFSWPRLLWLALLIPVGMTALYSVRFIFAATAVIFTRSDNLQHMWYQVYRLGMRPDVIYAPWLRFLVITLLPVGLVASVPARFLLGEPDLQLITIAIAVAGGFLYLSHKFWNYALTHYTSASS